MIRQLPLVRSSITLAAGLVALSLTGCTSRTDSSLTTADGVTYIRAPVAASVASVFVVEKQSVEQGTLLMQLDAKPLRAALEREQSQLEVTRAELEQARAAARAQAAAVAGNWSRVLAARNSVRENVARLRSAVANEKLRLAERALAERQYERAVKQAKQREITTDEMDERRASLEVAKERVEAATAAIALARSVLGLPASSDSPAAVPEGIERDFVGVRIAHDEFTHSLAVLGYRLELDPAKLANDENPLATAKDKQSFHEQLAKLAAEAPSVRLAAAHVGQIEQQVRQTEVALAQAEIRAPIAGIVTSRAVNPGNLVEPGQTLLVIRAAGSSAASKPAVESVGKAAASQH